MQVFAQPGESLQQVGGKCPVDWVEMREQRPGPDYVAAADGTWMAKPAMPSAEYPRFMGNQKLDLFTPAEQLAVVTATMADPVVKLLYDRLLGASYWSYEDPETEQGLVVLVDKGLLMPARKAEIVAQMQPVGAQ
ncbi:MAG: hypothetical protein LBJ15_19735 [Comamonas sp.]|jgi:hypothetical protein|uniref:hypothetical protein n=1 Tax=Comamonas sp. TaxID=34028 RepID=UPI0028244447|nr:hypothetical protein [Comamonas sp.]MDR0216208.1 hypothetical protein [Comamonas sp.]